MRKLKIGLMGEGANDVGITDGYGGWRFGIMSDYLEQLLGSEFDLEFMPIEISKGEAKAIRTTRSGSYSKIQFKGPAKKLMYFLMHYQKQKIDFDVLVFFSDTDKTQGEKASEKEAKKQYKERRNYIEEGFAVVEKHFNLHCILMMPIRILECWLLGDIKGFESIGCFPQKPKLPKKPEFIWGDIHNPESNYPKHYLKRILKNCNSESNTKVFKSIVRHNDIDNLRKNCPNSFEQFYQDTEELKKL
ncbi:DUF4276 family protein [Thiotrichales bacterium HSG14]|nr:DUF4276 family protein [Thiotrichales bacterium HSG14]